MEIVKGYEPLAAVLQEALNQAQRGKGVQRHANGKPFVEQPILEITRNVGDGYPIGQATKKIWESQRLATEAAIAERLGAINYIAASIIRLREINERQPTSLNIKGRGFAAVPLSEIMEEINSMQAGIIRHGVCAGMPTTYAIKE